jgi:hypothetical protein
MSKNQNWWCMKILIYSLILTVMVFAQGIPEYSRVAYIGTSSWADEDKDCQDTRQEVLIAENIADSLKFKTDNKCKVIYGIWHCLFTDQLYTNPSKLDIDHVIPLKEAHRSGAYLWSKDKRKAFANFLEDPNHLIAVSASANRSKGDRAPHLWVPPNEKFHREYCKIWVSIKTQWGLTVTKEELLFLQAVLRYDNSVIFPKLRAE